MMTLVGFVSPSNSEDGGEYSTLIIVLIAHSLVHMFIRDFRNSKSTKFVQASQSAMCSNILRGAFFLVSVPVAYSQFPLPSDEYPEDIVTLVSRWPQEAAADASSNQNKTIVAIMRSVFETAQDELVDLYHPYLKPTDYIMTKPDYTNWKFIEQLPSMKGVDYFSLQEIRDNAPILKKMGATFIAYDLEASYSPESDMVDPVTSMKQASEIARSNGLKLLAIPSHKLTDIYYSSFAPLVDIYGLQAQQYQPNTTEYRTYVEGIVPKLRAAHPGMPIITEISTNQGTANNMKLAFAMVDDVVDGVTIWYKEEGMTKLDNFLEWFHQNYR
jgi:hypothetical protein